MGHISNICRLDSILALVSYMYAYASGAEMPQACAKYRWLPSTHACYTLGESPQEGASEDLNLQIRSMAVMGRN
jgi:hypothetical protein